MISKLKTTLITILATGLISNSASAFETEIVGFDVNYNISEKGNICIKKADYDGSLGEKYPFGKLSIIFSNCYGSIKSLNHKDEEIGRFGRMIYANKIRKQYQIFQNEIESKSQIALNSK